MYKLFLTVSVGVASAAVAATNENDKANKSDAGVTYSKRAEAPRVDPPRSGALRIYWVTSDGKSFTIHGFNKSGFTLSLASDHVLAASGRFPRRVTFVEQFPNGAKAAGRVRTPGNVWVAQGKSGPCIVSSWGRLGRPPALPENGKSVTVFPRDFKEGGKESLLLNFDDGGDGLSFLLVGKSSAEQKAKADPVDSLAKTTARQFVRALQRRDLEAAMKIVDVPFLIVTGKEIIKERDSLREKIESLVKRQGRKAELKVEAVYSFAAFSDKYKVKESDGKRLRGVLGAGGRVVIYRVITEPMTDDRSAVLVRIRDGQPKVVGIR